MFMYGFYDFVPVVKEKAGFFKMPLMEQLAEPLERANAWIKEHKVNVVNIETVVLPNIHSPHEEGSTDPCLVTSGEFQTAWYQFVRVWYKSGE